MSTNRRESLLAELREEPSPRLAVASLSAAVAVIILLPLYAMAVALSTPRELSIAEQRTADVAAMGPLEIDHVARGKRFYNASCIACHAENARGVPNLGRDLVDGAYARRVSDAEFVAMIVRGRHQGDPGFTGPVAMPPRGGRDDFDDQAIRDIVAYLRALQEPSRIGTAKIPDVHVDLLDGPVETAAAASSASSSSTGVGTKPSPSDQPGIIVTSFDPEVLKRGKRVYASCIACHAKNGDGVKMQGASLLDSSFVRSKSDVDLREFIKTGRAPGAPGSRLNLNMPPKGGNPSLKDNQLDDVVVYIRWLQAEAEKTK